MILLAKTRISEMMLRIRIMFNPMNTSKPRRVSHQNPRSPVPAKHGTHKLAAEAYWQVTRGVDENVYNGGF
jgi:hypothetical protein